MGGWNMVERTGSIDRLAAYTLWVIATGMLFIAWGVALFGPMHVALMVGFGACVTSAAAATCHMRMFLIRTCAMIRRVHDLEPVAEPALPRQLHRIR